MTENTKHIINKIIECGRLDLYSDLKTLFPDWRKYQFFIDQIHTEIKLENNGESLHYYETFHRLSDKYDFDSLLNLIKGLTIAENNTKYGGSVSPIIALYKKLVEKAGLFYLTTGDKQGIYLLIRSLEQNPNDDITNITHWILNNSENTYLPFGTSTLISKTIPDIKIEVENWIEKQKEIVVREKQEKINKEKRDELRKEQASKNIKIHNAKNETEREYRQSLRDLKTFDLLRLISNDSKRPIYYYSTELSSIENIALEEEELLNKIIVKLKLNETKQSKRLVKQLIILTEK